MSKVPLLSKVGIVDVDSDLLWFISEWIYAFTRELTFSNIRDVRKVIQDAVEEFNKNPKKPQVDEILESLTNEGLADCKTENDVKYYSLNDKGYKMFQDKYRCIDLQDVNMIESMVKELNE